MRKRRDNQKYRVIVAQPLNKIQYNHTVFGQETIKTAAEMEHLRQFGLNCYAALP